MYIKTDLKDKKILYELNKNSRQTNEKIAKKVGLSKQAVAARIINLQEKNVIDYFFVKLNPTLLGFMHIKIYIKLYNITPKKEQEMIKELNKEKNVFWLSSLRGKYDLVASIYVKNIHDFSNKFERIFGKWKDYILERNIFILEEAYTYSKAYLLPNKNSEEFIYSRGKEKEILLDKTDQRLLSILNKNARKSLIEISKELNVSPDTINYRIKNLQKKNVIIGFSTKINFQNIGGNFYILSLKLQRMDKEKYNKIKTISKMNKNILTFIKVISDFDVELEIEVLEKKDFDNLIKQLREEFALEIKDYEIIEVIKEHRMTYYPF
ncbi:AsnC family transcriptional regulator [Candidatus Woesearchaeota archaeon]|nr:AsnC family transcriptional regulator [Candidatus Woesearchaeota archaeon]